MNNKCKEYVSKGMGLFLCSRRPWRDGYCKQHHPDAVKKREEESERRFRAKMDNTPITKLSKQLAEKDAAIAECMELFAELEEYFDGMADAEQFPDSPGMIPNDEMRHLVAIRALIAKHKKD